MRKVVAMIGAMLVIGSVLCQTESSLTMELSYGSGGKDETRIDFNPLASDTFDNAFDANKPGSAPGVPTLYTFMAANLWYGINTLPSLTQVTTVGMGLRPDMNTTMMLTPKGLQTFDPTTYIMLEDKKTNRWHNLHNGGYSFTTATTDAQKRFVLHFTPPAKITTTNAVCNTSGTIHIEQPGSASWNYTLKDDNSNTISSGALNSGNSITVNAVAGSYLLTLRDNNGYEVIKSIEVQGTQEVTAAFNSTASMAEVGQVIQFASVSGNAVSYEWDYGDGTRDAGPNVFHSYQSEGTYNVQLVATSADGCADTATQQITIYPKIATGIGVHEPGQTAIWSHERTLYIDLSQIDNAGADLEVCNIVGQIISREHLDNSGIYSKSFDQLTKGYIVVKIVGANQSVTRKLYLNTL